MTDTSTGLVPGLEDKTRLIIDFENDEELKKFYERNIGDLEGMKFLEDRSKKDQLKTYNVEYEDNTRKQFNKYLANSFRKSVELALAGKLSREDHQEEILLLDAVNDYLQSRNIIQPNETFYWK